MGFTDPIDESGCILCCPIFCIKCIVLGWLCWPINFCLCLFSVDEEGRWLESYVCCNPAKRYCSVNGRNKGKVKCYIPWGIIEVLGFFATLFTYLKAGGCLKIPCGYIDASTILGENVTYNPSEYYNYLGGYNHWHARNLGSNKTAKVLAQISTKTDWTMLDREMLTGWTIPTTMEDEGFVSDTTEDFKAQLAGNFTGNLTDVIIFSHWGFCKGLYSKKMDKKFVLSNPAYCKPIDGKAFLFDDMPAAVKLLTNEAAGNGMKIFGITALLANLCRMWLIYRCPSQLRRPGNQWICGFWAGLCLFSVQNNFKKMGKNLFAADTVVPYGSAVMATKEMGQMAGSYGSFDNPAGNLAKDLRVGNTIGKFAMVLSFLQLYLSEEAYCTDCTHYAYTEDNLNRVRTRNARRKNKLNVKDI